MSTQAIRLRAEALRSVGYASISTSFVPLGSAFENPIRIFHLQNLTTANIIYSFDGTTDHGVVAAGSFILLDVTTNKSLDQGQFISQGTTLYVATISGETLPTSGDIYLSTFYGATH